MIIPARIVGSGMFPPEYNADADYIVHEKLLMAHLGVRGFPPAVLCFPKITRPYLQEACAHFFPARFQLSVRLSSESELFGIVHLAVLSFLCAERNFSTTKIWGERHGS